MSIPSEMKALLLVGDGYTRTPSGSTLEAMEPYLQPGSIAVPAPGTTQVLIKVSLASINPSDVAFIKGQYGQPRVKGRPAGFEGVGVIVAGGDESYPKSLVGKRVAFATGLSNWGSWADYAVAEAAACIPLLDTVRDEDGAAMIVNPLTALAMFDIVSREGERAFIMTAGASQLCKLIIGLASEEGFRPIVTVRRDEQIALLKEIGAAHVLNEKSPDFEASLREVIKAEQPRIFLDAVTGPLASAIFNAMPKRSRWIIYGRLDPEATIIREPGQLIFQHKHIEGFWLSEWMRQHKDRRGPAILEAQKRFSDGRWTTDVTAVVPLAEAMARVPAELARPNGKVFIRP
ncbi:MULTISPECIES: zinc-binding dehydrogenase [unclassified Mesorhizobium]|uniref:zinc-binding dehydrogenase n=1 Tax=unclassified Mesorhizobium TaxID=325217 RepID=UPI00112C5443|nr:MULTISPECIES: zinc-binding dehydrogenase [unclassified Mesorhizobium]MBZ9897896.1 zinc-binding dehydrogenase [Mesorhizobium sp. BR1-1-6]TPK66076.1 zinc-binding dehydrogenase [Mesorhizobium sp. B2-5-1]TPM60454.1 zinc-binding dehydrogenase [Mesorhizobium sp. B2-1-9]TPM88215.1 zinc-binding dehydrogenase [Mesorhizobium sp. B2-1-4]TPN10866.1 zinc-binding dehydrogenase [Mesorhizobium sp. B2-1-2]